MEGIRTIKLKVVAEGQAFTHYNVREYYSPYPSLRDTLPFFGKCLMTLSTLYPYWTTYLAKSLQRCALLYKNSFIKGSFGIWQTLLVFLKTLCPDKLHHINWDGGNTQ